CFGTIIKLIKDVREKEWADALFSEGAWLLVFAGILVLVLGGGLIGPGAKTIGKWLLISGASTRVILRGLCRERKLAGIGIGLILLLDGLKNLLGNVLSYSRLMALGMATGVIAMTVNLVATLARDMIPLFGWLAMIVILIGGHIFNIAINTLGGFVHTTRLQFVEFFPYFFEGGGKAFEPFRAQNKFTVVR
ncbi:V-type ATP synthase subunit I, partial [bacterium]|nr:V-type ATP synthase subunit I [bacterium]